MLNLIVFVQALFSVIKKLLKALGHALGHGLNFDLAKAEVKLFHNAVL